MKPSTVLQIRCPRGLAHRIVAPSLPRLLQQHPDLRVRIHEYDWPVEIVIAAGCLGLTIDRVDRSDVIVDPVGHVRMVTCASPEFVAIHGTPSHPDDLDPRHCIHARRHWEFRRAAERYALRPASKMIFSDEASAVSAAVHGGGFVQLPQYEAEEAIACGLLTEVLAGWSVQRLLTVVTERSSVASARVQIFLRFLRTLFPAPAVAELTRQRARSFSMSVTALEIGDGHHGSTRGR